MPVGVRLVEADTTPVQAENGPTIEMHDVRKVFDDLVAVDSVALTSLTNEVLGIIGPSGSGKTTTIRLLLGLLQPTWGTVRVFGRDPSRFRRSDRERIGYLPQHFVLYPDLTVTENLAFMASAYGLSWRTRGHRIDETLELVQLTDARKQQAQHLSGGMQRRLALAAALLPEPDLLVLDEPTAGLDPLLRSDVWEIFERLKADGCTILVTTQYVTEAEYCDRVVLIDQGRVAASGTPEELRTQAFGGDVLRATIPDLDRALVRKILALPFVRSGQWVGTDDLALVVGAAPEAIPALTEALRAWGRPLAAIEESRESFDRVFVELVAPRDDETEAMAGPA